MRFSIIIPVYNAAHTLEKCLASIRSQNFQGYQVIISDDGSSDESVKIAGEFVSCDPRFVVITGAHAGTGAARNRGLERAEGEYILYMDADDYWLRDDLLQTLEHLTAEQPADVYMYQMLKVTEEGEVLSRYTKSPFFIENKAMPLADVYSDLVKDGHTLASACNKCVRKGLLADNRIRFREDISGEDIDWVMQVFAAADTICLLNIRAYAYVQHKTPSRSTAKDVPNDLVDIISAWNRRLTEKDPVCSEAACGVVAFEYAICMGNYHLLSANNKRFLRENVHLLTYGLDRKTILIRRFYRVFGYRLTCLAIRLYLLFRRIW